MSRTTHNTRGSSAADDICVEESECWRFNAMSATRAIFMAKKVDSGHPQIKNRLFPLELLFSYFQKKLFFFTPPPLYILVYKNEIRKKKKKKIPDLPAGFFLAHPAHRKQFFTKGGLNINRYMEILVVYSPGRGLRWDGEKSSMTTMTKLKRNIFMSGELETVE